jgi:2-methylcitrate dehydratase PrpD
MTITHSVARHIVDMRFGTFSEAQVSAAKDHILYTTGTALAGANAPGIAQLRASARRLGDGDQSTVLVHGDRLPASAAALVNGAMGHARELDINDDRIGYKSSVAVIPAAWAVAQRERPVSGQDLITAVCLGIDLGVRLGLAIRPYPAHGLFNTLGPIAAAAACARLMKLDVTATHDALGIAYCQCTVAGLSLTSPSLAKRLAAGLAAQAGVTSATMAQAGFPATTEVFAGAEGLFQTFFHQEGDHDVLLADLGRRFEIFAAGPKPFPSCRYTHAGVTAALALRAKHRVPTSDIREIHVHIGERDLHTVWGSDERERSRRAAPQGIVDAQFSIPFTVAATLLRGRLTLEEFSAQSLADADILALAARVRPVLTPAFDDWPKNIRPQTVELVLLDGRTLSERVDAPKGSPENRFTTEEVEESFRAMGRYAQSVPESAIEKFIHGMRNLETLPDVSGLLAALA